MEAVSCVATMDAAPEGKDGGTGEPLAKRQCIACVKKGGDLQLLEADAVAEGMRELDPLWALVEDGKVRSEKAGPNRARSRQLQLLQLHAEWLGYAF